MSRLSNSAYNKTKPLGKSFNSETRGLDRLSSFNFPVLSGVQAGRQFYITMWSLRVMRRISIFDGDELPAEFRAQRILNKARIPEMTNYVVSNPDNYIFSALTVSIDSEIEFQPLSKELGDSIGMLRVPMDAKFIINDGQHRRAAIVEALEERPALENEHIAVVFFLDVGLARSQQMFADLNRYAIRPSSSLGLLYDHRNEKAKLAKLVIMKSNFFKDIIDMERSSLARFNKNLFTLSAFYRACSELLNEIAVGDLEKDAAIARQFWEAVTKAFPAWKQVKEGKVSSGDLREGYIHSHGIAIHALGKAGNFLLRHHPKNLKERLKKLSKIDWSRKNLKLWEGRALIGGKVSKATTNVTLTTNVIKQHLDLPLTPDEEEKENSYLAGIN